MRNQEAGDSRSANELDKRAPAERLSEATLAAVYNLLAEGFEAKPVEEKEEA